MKHTPARMFARLALLLAVALAVTPALPARADDHAIVVGTSGKESDAEVYYAQELGFFKQAGLDVTINTFTNGASVASAVVSNALQIGNSNILALASARSKGLPFIIVAPGSTYSSAGPTTLLAAAPNTTIKSGADLAGKIVAGVALGGLDEISLRAWIDKNGGDATKSKYVELPPSEMVAALQRGTVAAVSLPDPALSSAQDDKTVKIIGENYTSVAPQFLITAWFTTSDWAAKNPDTVKRFVDVIAKTADWANTHHDEAAKILFKYTKISEKTAHARFARTLNVASLQPTIDIGQKYNIIAKTLTATDLLPAK